MRLVAQLKGPPDPEGIRWLVIETDEEDTGGVFLFYHQSLDEPSEFDSWYENVEGAKREASDRWGVGEEDWRPGG